MPIEKVIEVYNDVSSLSEAPLVIVTEILWMIVGIVFIIHLIKDRKLFSPLGSIIRGFFLIIIFLIISSLFVSIIRYDFSMDEKQWKKDYLKPYISSLPDHKYDVKDFSQLLINKSKEIQSIYLNSKTKPVSVELTVLDKNGSTKKIIVQTVFQKETINTSYLTYKTIKKDISDIYKADAYYETILHIPKEYKVLVPSN
ncbi:hypothetical protein J6TS2_39760 [Heyndrickxia sporothermodurans]|nr:hypothetical protein J6TS2_39760 [Heyndrickxia sporothermodurans]